MKYPSSRIEYLQRSYKLMRYNQDETSNTSNMAKDDMLACALQSAFSNKLNNLDA